MCSFICLCCLFLILISEYHWFHRISWNGFCPCYGLNICIPHNIHGEVLAPHMAIFGEGTSNELRLNVVIRIDLDLAAVLSYKKRHQRFQSLSLPPCTQTKICHVIASWNNGGLHVKEKRLQNKFTLLETWSWTFSLQNLRNKFFGV